MCNGGNINVNKQFLISLLWGLCALIKKFWFAIALPLAQVGAMLLQRDLKQCINEKTSACNYTRGHRNENIMRSTKFHGTQGM